MGQHLDPVRLGGRVVGGAHEAEVLRVAVGLDVPPAVQVLDAVLVVPLAGDERLELARGLAGVQHAVLVGDGVVAADHHEAARLGLPHEAAEGVVVLLVDQHVLGGIGAQHVSPDLVGTQGLEILAGVEEGPPVLGPGQVALGLGEGLGIELARVQVLEADRVEAPAHHVLDHRDHVAVGVGRGGARPVELVALGPLVGVEQYLLGGLQAACPAAVQGVFPALLVAAVVPAAVVEVGDGVVVFLDAAGDLLEEGLAQLGGVGGRGLGVGVLGLQVGDHLRILALVQPVVVVDARVAELLEDLGFDLGHGRVGEVWRAGTAGEGDEHQRKHHRDQGTHGNTFRRER